MTDSRSEGISISVVRTGGFAGLKREWNVNSADAPEVDWAALVDACPWKSAGKPRDSRAADRFVWRIEAKTAAKTRTVTLADSQVSGAWKTLVDEVRARPGN
jgi:hypothetical protein